MKTTHTTYHVQMLVDGKPEPVGVKKDKDSKPESAIFPLHKTAANVLIFFRKQYPDKKFRILKQTITTIEYPWQ